MRSPPHLPQPPQREKIWAYISPANGDGSSNKLCKKLLKRAEAFCDVTPSILPWSNFLSDSHWTSELKRLSSRTFSSVALLPRVTFWARLWINLSSSCVASFLSRKGQDEACDELKIRTGRPPEVVPCNCIPRFLLRLPSCLFHRREKIKLKILKVLLSAV